MCKQHNPRVIDKCMRDFVKHLTLAIQPHYQIKACCCGHNKYPMTIVVYRNGCVTQGYYDLVSGLEIPRKRRFYTKDKDGYYFIKEVLEQWNQKK